MNTLTLKIGSTEKTLDAWGLTAPVMSLKRLGVSTLTCLSPGTDPAADPAIDYATSVTLYEGRAGSGTSWSGGQIIFVGKRRKFRGQARTQRGIQYVFEDVWGSMLRLTYQQQWNLQSGVAPVCRVFLFQKIGAGSGDGWSYWKTFEQATDIINYAASCGIPIQPGTIDGIMPQPVYPMRAPSCAQALSVCLESMPDMTGWFDYSTTPPTLHIRQRVNCTPITLPYADGVKHFTTDIDSREDLIVNEVVIQYQQTNNVDGIEYTNWPVDAYPIGATGQVEQSVVAAVDLRGANSHTSTGTLTAATFDPSTPAFWADKIKSLGDATIPTSGDGALNVIDYAVKDTSGTTISLATYPRELKRGNVAPWMVDSSNAPIKVIEAIVTGHVSYAKNDTNATSQQRHKVENHAVSARVRLTNSPAGDVNYKALAQSDTTETEIINLAYLFWCSCNNVAPNIVSGVVTPPGTPPSITGPSNLQWEGAHVIREMDKISNVTITPGNVLNLDDSTGGNPDWAGMNATIEEVAYDFFTATTTIRFGPHQHQTWEQFFAMMTMFRWRPMPENVNQRSSGQDAGGAGTDIGADGRIEDSSTGPPPDASLHTVAAPPDSGVQMFIQHDANNGVLIMGEFNTSSGAVDNTDLPDLSAKLSDVDDTGAKLRWRAFPYKRASDCTAVYRWILCSKEYTGSPPSGSDPT